MATGGSVVIFVLLIAQGLAEEVNKQSPSLICYPGGHCEERPDKPPITGTDLDLGRLPYWLIPYHYNIELQPYIYEGSPPFNFDGSVEIFVDCEEATDTIYLNTLDLTILEETLEVTVTEDSPIQPDPPEWISYEIDTDRQFFIIYLDRELTVDAQYRIAVSFNGTLQGPSQSYGLYWDSYETDTETRYLVTTQFESSSARRALPCFDEPDFKATYDTTLVRKSGWKSLSNMPVNHQESRGDDWVADVYDRTVVMSDYLLCFTICDFLFVQSISPRGHVTRIWARSDIIYAADWALESAEALLEWYEDYTGIPYPLPKLDHIAIPSKGGAMENHGLITYGEYALIFDPAHSTTNDKRYVAEIIAHEVAHKWWGNLVTCYWWDHIWLNEAFATLFMYHPLDDVFGWKGADLELVVRTQSIMRSDEQNTSSPIRIQVDSPWQGGQAFHSFTYYKGGAVLRGMMRILGEDSFQRAMNLYLNRHAYDTAQTDDLWNALNEQAAEDGITDTDGSPLDFKQKFDPWLEQRGFPMVTTTRTVGGEAELQQQLFLNPQEQEMPSSPYDYKWNVPIAFYTEEDPFFNTSTKEWMNREDVTITDGVPENLNSWMVVNTNQEYYFSTNYDEASRADIVRQLRSDHESIAELNRAQMIYDAFRQTRAKLHKETVGMDMTSYIHSEDDYAPWKTARDELDYAALMMLRFPTTYDKFENYMNGQVDRIYNQIGWVHEEEDSALMNQLLRGVILQIACTYGTAECITEAVAQYDQWQQDADNNPVHPDNRLTVYCTAIGAGDQADWDFAHSVYQTYDSWLIRTPAAAEVSALLTAMACSTDEATLQRYLDYTFDEEQIRGSDASSALNALAESVDGRWVVWEHLKANWLDNATPSGVSKHVLFLTVVNGFANDNDVLELENFIANYPPENQPDEITYDTATATVQENNAWADENVADLDNWFDEHIPLSLLNQKPGKRGRNGHHLGLLYDRTIYNMHWVKGKHEF